MGLFDSVVLLVVIVTLCAYVNSRYETDWNSVSLNEVASSDIIPLPWLTFLRFFFAIVIWGSTAVSVIDPEGLKLELLNRQGKYVKVVVKHFQRLTFFTFWCWMLHGAYFLAAGTASASLLLGISLHDVMGTNGVSYFNAITWVMYEVCG